MKRSSPRIKSMRTRFAHALFGVSLTAVCLGAALLIPMPVLAQVASWHTVEKPIEFVRGQKHWSESRSHYIVWQPDGNLVVARADGGYVWGFDSQPGLALWRVDRVVWQPDGNLVAYDPKGVNLWSALSKDPDRNARLVLQTNGALQIVSSQRGVVLWSSDGKLSLPAAAPAATAPAPAAPKPAAIREGVNYTIQSMMTGKCYDAPDDRSHQWDCHGGAWQQWRFEQGKGSGTYQIVSSYTGKCLEVERSEGDSAGVVRVATCQGSANQAVRLEPHGDVFAIRFVHSGKCLNIPRASLGNGDKWQQWLCYNGDAGQLFKITAK